MDVAPGHFHRKIEEQQNQKKSLLIWFPTYIVLVVFTQQLKILVTSLSLEKIYVHESSFHLFV